MKCRCVPLLSYHEDLDFARFFLRLQLRSQRVDQTTKQSGGDGNDDHLRNRVTSPGSDIVNSAPVYRLTIPRAGKTEYLLPSDRL